MLRWNHLLLIGVGGTVGTLGRYGVAEAVGHGTAWPWATFTVNVLGSLALGVLAGLVARKDDPRRLLLGTGVLGGFTTYSTFAVETDRLLRDGDLLIGALYPLTSVALGLAAAAAGLVLTRSTR